MILTRVKNGVGATAIEYGLIASLIGVLAVGGMSTVGVNLSNTYCTISKHLGGTGDCPENNSPKKITPITVVQAISDGVESSFIPASLGGEQQLSSIGSWGSNPDLTDGQVSDDIGKAMENLNKTDPIVGVFGLYDDEKNPITDYSNAISVTEKATRTDNGNGDFIYSGGHWGSPYYQVVTQSGAVYNAIRPSDSDHGELQLTTDSSVIYKPS